MVTIKGVLTEIIYMVSDRFPVMFVKIFDHKDEHLVLLMDDHAEYINNKIRNKQFTLSLTPVTITGTMLTGYIKSTKVE